LLVASEMPRMGAKRATVQITCALTLVMFVMSRALNVAKNTNEFQLVRVGLARLTQRDVDRSSPSRRKKRRKKLLRHP
jgi:hypothetical protein